MANKKILITGAAGFIGSHLALRLLSGGATVMGVDNINPYYDPKLKLARLKTIKCSTKGNWEFKFGDITNKDFLTEVFAEWQPSIVIHLAAQAGVRNSITNPNDYLQANIVGFFNVLETCRNFGVPRLVYASSSSVYGDTITDSNRPLNFYAATKKSNEVMAHSYSALFGLHATGLRLFTVYGAAGRPDMLYFKIANNLSHGQPVELYNNGDCKRDFTYIDDVIEGIIRVIDNRLDYGSVQHKIYNLGGGNPVWVCDFADTLIGELIQANVLSSKVNWRLYFKLLPSQAGDASITCADNTDFKRDFSFVPKTILRQGLRVFAKWFAKFKEG